MINYDDGEHNLLSFYGIKTLNPTKVEDINIESTEPVDVDNIKSLDIEDQFDILNKLVKYDNESDNQRRYIDEDVEDPLRGPNTNVIKDLIAKQVISSKNDPSMNEYLISSRQFNSEKFLSTVHKNTSIDDLTRYLNYLQQSILGQQDELKQTIDENYTNFIECKNAIDRNLIQFKQSKTRAQQEMEKIRIYNPSRDRDRSKNQGMDNNFLINELEEAIKNLTLLTSTMIRPIKENKAKEVKISKLIDFVGKNEFLFNLPSTLIKNVKASNHDDIVEDLQRYTKLKQKLIEEENNKLDYINRRTASAAADDDVKQGILQDHQSVNTLLIKIFSEVDRIIEEYRRSTYNELLSFDHEITNSRFNRSNNTKFLSLVDKIDQLNGDLKHLESPINTFLKAQLKKSNKDLNYQIVKFEDRFSSMQKKLLDYIQSLSDHRVNGSYVKYIAGKYKNLEEYYRASSMMKSLTFEEKESIILEIFDSSDNLDLSLINETWLIFLNFVNYLSDVYLKNISKFVNNYNYYVNNNRDVDSKQEIRQEFVNSIIDISNKLFNIFNSQEDTSNQLQSSPKYYSNILPYYTNSLSSVFYISKISDKVNLILTSFGKNITLVGNLGKSNDTNKIIKNLRNISHSINQRILEAVCAVWVNDCSQFYDLENWEVDEKIFKFDSFIQENKEVDEGNSSITKLVNIIEFYSIFMLRKIKSLMFISNLNTEEEDYVKILVSVEIQFMRCLSILVDSVMKKYNLESQNLNTNSKIDEVFKVLTMNNFDRITRVVYPELIKNYDKKFDKELSKQSLKLFSDIDKAGLTILDDILSKEKLHLDENLSKFFTTLKNNNGRKENKVEIHVDNFIYEVLIHFVKLVHNIKPITNKEIFINIINELQNFFLKTFLDSFRALETTLKHFDKLMVNFRLDINFFIEVFEPSKTIKLNEYSFNIAEIILKTVLERETTKLMSDKEFDRILIRALKDSASQFDCLSR
ncbi:hypothetical protein CANTEDRAFT_136386 [Yamadazyma tenuis ATCC 10573]|uniref:Exocyst complex component SEC5 n=1 Tax=Candida tenuis (strain ATCC 10573 / BCRC 21748 / CBS 615 / JCM 9827 / NBRC 10315 / NRRL Y-1498 / VKM Y-70) TaxID=590646 RepID=G3B930_CANTC|nr:uncharacterized protein CANTEDRAFT_136386 [Yamadazyma tenuis ATCC 10573]EGV62450.1 hypothetical protein CANTEDRAFT_136386 [Yamadazyma tenuis ATCC 10573]